MQDLFSGILIGVLGSVVLLLLLSRYRGNEGTPLLLAYAGHVISGFAQVLITGGLYGSGDIFGYARRGEELGAALSIDFQTMGWELLKLLFHQDAALPITISGIGSSTGSMSAIAGFANYFTGGGVYASCVLMGVFSFYGKLATYEAFRQTFPQPLHTRLAIANVLMPSVVFWSSGLLKESVALIGLGPLVLGVHNLLRGRYGSGLLLAVFGVTTVGLVKAYILFAFAVAVAAWFYAARAWRDRAPSLRPFHLAIGLALALGGLSVLSSLFPQYRLEALSDQAAYYQDMGQQVRGGSTFALIPEDAGVLLQLAYAPLALMTSLYRPFIFEGSNPQMFINALETTALLVMSVYVVTKIPLKTSWRVLLANPLLVFAFMFVLGLGVAVGLTSTNLGTLSRYRVPLVPFFASLLVVLMGQRPREQPPTPVLASNRPQRPTRPMAP